MKHQLVLPMAVYVFYIFFLLMWSFRIRVTAVRSGKMSHKYFRAFGGDAPPEEVIVAGRHFDNQFQLPLLFLIGGCAYLATGTADEPTLVLAWLFVAARVAHSVIHLGANRLQKRMLVYGLGWLVTLVLWGRLVYLVLE